VTPKRVILLLVPILFLYLGLYSWNQRTGTLDRLADNTGLEVVGAVLRPALWAHDRVVTFWDHYINLVGVREDHDRLKAQLEVTSRQLAQYAEDRAELSRLRQLLTLAPPDDWQAVGARVLASRLGPQGVLDTITIDHGYFTGAAPGTPVATHLGVVGRVLRSGPHTASVLLLVDSGSRVSVISHDNRTQGVLVGGGPGNPLEVRYVAVNAKLDEGEILVTSGLDGAFPKGLPVARVITVTPPDLSMFQGVLAAPLVDFESLEEVLLMQRPPARYALQQAPVHASNGTAQPQTQPAPATQARKPR
jgi:rod shape-determining protein MreC